MNHFTIKDIENLCGIKAHTLRIWEQRYNKLFVPKRKQSQHRIYDNDDLKELLRISFLYHNGHKISKIAELNPEQIQQLVETFSITEDNHEVFVHQLIEAGVDFDKEKFEKIVNGLVLRVGLEKSIINVFYPFLQRIGLLWMTNNLIPAQEHFASHIIRKKIILATDGLETNAAASTVVVFAPLGEHHEIPLLTANYFLKKYNSRTIYFGANVPEDYLAYYLKYHPASHLYAHIVTSLKRYELENYIFSLCEKFPDKQVVLSGPACRCIEQKSKNLRILFSMEEMIAFAKETGSLTSA